MIRSYLIDIINDHKTQGEWKFHSGNEVINYKSQGEWKTQLTMIINFISSKDFDKIRTMHTRNINMEIMMGNEKDEIIEELFESLLQKYQEELEEKMKGSEFVFDSIGLLHYNLHKISLNRCRLYIDSPKWLKNKKATINPKKNDDKSFQCAVTVALNYQNIKNNPEKIPKTKPFIEQYDCKEMDFPSYKKEWEKFELINWLTCLT